jgi:hypothetical protein
MIAEYVSHDSDVTRQYSTGIFMSGTNNELRDSTHIRNFTVIRIRHFNAGGKDINSGNIYVRAGT